MWLSDKGWTGARPGPGGAARRQTQKGTFTLNSNRPVSGAGSGIVAGAWQGQEGPWAGDGGQGHRLPPRGRGALPPWGARDCGGSRWGGGRYWQIFMACRCSICRCLIELCGHELFPILICIGTIPGSGSGVSRVPPDKMSSRLQTPQRTCELEGDFIQWQGYWLIQISVCLSGSPCDICHPSEDVVSPHLRWKKYKYILFFSVFRLEQTKQNHHGYQPYYLLSYKIIHLVVQTALKARSYLLVYSFSIQKTLYQLNH